MFIILGLRTAVAIADAAVNQIDIFLGQVSA